MRSVRCLTLSIVVVALALSTALSPVALAAPAVWSGFTYSFAHTVAAPDQDEITPNVTITRQATGGLYNAVSESAYALDISPKNTLWATTYNNPGAPLIAATEWSELNFTDWRTAYGGAGTLATNILAANGNAVVYLQLDDVYLDLKFTQLGGGILRRWRIRLSPRRASNRARAGDYAAGSDRMCSPSPRGGDANKTLKAQ